MTNNVISTRLNPQHIAKARDGLKLRGYEDEQLDNVSNIVRLTFYYGLTDLMNDADQPASEESRLWVQQKIGQKQRKTNLSLGDILK